MFRRRWRGRGLDRPLTSARVLDILSNINLLSRFFITYRFLLHLEQPRKPKLREKLQQEIPEVLRQELADLHGDGDGDGEGGGDGDGQSSLIIVMVMVMVMITVRF